MKDLLLTGYYGFSNIGDEAVLECIVNQLKAAIPGVRITVLSNSPAETAASYGVNAVNRWKLMKVIKSMWRADILILGGGSLLQDVTGSKSILFYLGQIILARLCGCPVFLYAQGIGPIVKKRHDLLCRFVLKRTRGISVRDRDSYQFLREAGIKKEKLFLTCDPVLVMEEKEMPPPLPGGKKAGFALREWSGLNIEALAGFADLLIEGGWQVVFLPFNEPKDREIALKVMGKMTRRAFLPAESFSSATMFSAIKCMDMVVAMRLHAAIMAAASAVPFLPLVYDPKVLSFAHETGHDIAVELKDLQKNTLWQAGEKVIKNLAQIGEALARQKEDWLLKSKANAMIAREYAFNEKKVDYEAIVSEIEQDKERM